LGNVGGDIYTEIPPTGKGNITKPQIMNNTAVIPYINLNVIP
jgi:hypothetical protein